MIRDITIGQYYPTESILHKLDPRVKLFGTVLYIISLFIAKNPAVYLLAAVFLFTCIHMSRVPVKYIIKGLRSIFIILLLSVFLNIFFVDGHVLVEFWIFKITVEGIIQAVYMAVRFVLLIMGSSLMTLTTTPNSLTDGLEKGLRFLKVIKIPVHEIAMMMSIALRFIPILIEETDKIMKAQAARGADFENGNIFKRVKALVPILVPLFVSAIRRAGELATAMEARCYRGGKNRSQMKPLKYCSRDVIGYVILWLYLGAMITVILAWEQLL